MAAIDNPTFRDGVYAAEVIFDQITAGGLTNTYTGTITLPPGASILDVAVHGIDLWNGTSATIIVGDGADNDGFFTSTNLVATDLLAGEVNNIEHPGGKAGAYITAEQRKLRQSTSRNVIGVVTQTGTGTAGYTVLVVTYVVPTVQLIYPVNA